MLSADQSLTACFHHPSLLQGQKKNDKAVFGKCSRRANSCDDSGARPNPDNDKDSDCASLPDMRRKFVREDKVAKSTDGPGMRRIIRIIPLIPIIAERMMTQGRLRIRRNSRSLAASFVGLRVN